MTNSSLSNGVVTLTGVNPSFSSITFTVNPTDIICFELTVSLPTPSTSSGNAGVYIGTKTNQGVYIHSFNDSSYVWIKSTTTNNNPYFLNHYNLSKIIMQKHYILGSDVSLSDVPYGETSDSDYAPKAIQLPSGITTTNIRSGYNTNTSMVIQFSNFKIYNITHKGFFSKKDIFIPKIGHNWSQAFEFYEY